MLPSGKTYCSSSIGELNRRLRACDECFEECQTEPNLLRGVHFFLGDPPLKPPTIRGSVLLRLTSEFLIDNLSHFLVGRPVDLDGVKFGHLPELPADLMEEQLELKSDQFLEVCSLLAKLEPNAWFRFSSERQSEPALSLLKHLLPSSALEYMRTVDSFHARAFEYELSPNFNLKYQHVASLHIPQPYAHSLEVKQLVSMLGSKVITYNPKYGIEAACI